MVNKAYLIFILFISLSSICYASDPSGLPSRLGEEVGFEQKVGTRLSPDVSVFDEFGRTSNFGQYLGHKPVILSFVYFKCPNLCTLVLNGIAESVSSSGLKAGQEFDLLSISINPAEKNELALAKKRTYLARLGQSGDGNPSWHFLTASKAAIQILSSEAGFHFKYDPISGEYSHPSGFVVLTPSGIISRYFFGISFDPKELRKSILDAGTGKSGKTLNEIILNCFHYSPENGKYGMLIAHVLQWMSLLMIAALGGLFIWLSWSRKKGVA